MVKNRLLEIFNQAMDRLEETVIPVTGWFERMPNLFQYRFRLESVDLTEFQKYYDKGKLIGTVFDFSKEEGEEIGDIAKISLSHATGFYIPEKTFVFPHLDYSPQRSLKCTIVNLTGEGSMLDLYNEKGDIIFKLPEVIDQYTLHPLKVIHSYTVADETARLINIWHD